MTRGGPTAMDLTRRDHFDRLAGALCSAAGDERISLYLEAETSDFLRFNRAAVRQATRLTQAHVTLAVSIEGRKAQTTLTLSGHADADIAVLLRERAALLALLPELPLDPFLLLPDAVVSSQREEAGQLPDARTVIDLVTRQASGLDLVGFYAAGPVVRAFADSRGQRNWHRVESFHFEWCLYHERDKAVRTSYAGTHFRGAEFSARLHAAQARLPLLELAARRLQPGPYRAYFTPAAMGELLETLAWSGFGAKDRQSGTSSLMRLAHGDAALDARVQLSEATSRGVAPAFTAEGFAKPDAVALVDGGRHVATLTSARSAREFAEAGNGANAEEYPESLHMACGTLPEGDVLDALGTGLYVSNLWYLNYSRQACRMTGMTRYASIWVEDGRPIAPLDVMRFDDSFLGLFGNRLVALTDHAETLIGGDTYQRRQLTSITTPGAIVEGLNLTL